MNRLTTGLTLLLAAQLLLSAALFWPRQQSGESDAQAALLTLDTGSVDRLVISDGDGSLLLLKQDAGWVMPDYHGLPVQDSRLNRVLIDLPALPRGWPVAGSESAVERFEVSREGNQRKVEYFEGETLAGEIFVGTSPGFRKVHVRAAGDDSVYAVEFNTFELPTTANEWLEKSLLRMKDIDSVQGLDYRIDRGDDSWQGDGDSAPAQAEVDKLVNGLSGLRVSGAADIATAAVLDELDAPPTLVVERGEQRYEYRLYEIEDAYYVRRSDIPVYFSLGAFDYDRLNDVNADSLYAPAEGDAASGDAEESGGAN